MKHSRSLPTGPNTCIRSIVRFVLGTACAFAACNAAAQPSESVVTIFAQKKGGSSQGTGFVFGTGGRVATAYHVVKDATSIEVSDKSFSKMTKVRIDRIDARRDIAVLIVDEAKDLPSLRLATAAPTPQAKILVAGTPRGMPKQVLYGRTTSDGYISSLGIVSSQGKAIFAEGIDVLPLDVTVYGGMSGAPVLNENGSVAGVLSGSLDEGRGIGWAIPAKYIVELMNTSALGKKAGDLGLWPDLSLMNRNWNSLTRSYSRKLSTDEMAALEALYVSFQTLKGVWQGTIVDSKPMAVPGKGTCVINMNEIRTLSFIAIDEEKSVIRGLSRSKASNLDYEFKGTGDGSWCTSLDKNVVASQADIEIGIEDIEGFSQDDAAFNSVERIKECLINSSNCPAGYFGKKDRGNLEMISASKIRWRKGILEKIR